jgi:hypothetical protein
MSDWELPNVKVQVDTLALVKPPIFVLSLTLVVAVTSAGLFFWNNPIGYLIALGASILGGVTALQDQKRRGHPSYVTLAWFTPALRVVRYFVLAVTLAHVAQLAIAAAKGSGLFW